MSGNMAKIEIRIEAPKIGDFFNRHIHLHEMIEIVGADPLVYSIQQQTTGRYKQRPYIRGLYSKPYQDQLSN